MESLDFNKLVSPCTFCLFSQNFNGDNAFTLEHKGTAEVANVTNTVSLLNNGTFKTVTKVKNNAFPFTLDVRTSKPGSQSLELLVPVPQVEGLGFGAFLDNKSKDNPNVNLSTQFNKDGWSAKLLYETVNKKLTVFGVKKQDFDFGTVRAGGLLTNDFGNNNRSFSLGASLCKELNASCFLGSLRVKGSNLSPLNSVVSDLVVCNTEGNKKAFGVEGEYFLPESRFTFTVGAKWYLTSHKLPNPTFVNAKVNDEYKAEVGLTHALTENVSASVSAQGLLKKEFTYDDLKFGFKLSVN